MEDDAEFVERWRPELRLYETVMEEIEAFIPPEQCLKGEFLRLFSHPAVVLRVIPDKAFEPGPQTLPS